ncbi:MAG: hypothetical protein ACKVTZ_05875 [Bacteroidia bacterium]
MKYKLLGGGEIEGTTPAELVQAMRSYSFNPMETVEAFMQSTSRACSVQSGDTIRHDTEANFISDLVEKGYLSELSAGN